MMLTKTKVAMLLLSATGALFVSHKHQKDTPGIVHTISTVTVTGAATPARVEPVKEPTRDEPCVCPPTPAAEPPLGQR